MPSFRVTLPITGKMVVDVKADDPQGAITAALNSEYSIDDVHSWTAMERICEGNICYAEPSRATAKQIEDEDDDEG